MTGTYSYITIVGAPSQAAPGERITFRVRIFNEGDFGFYAFPYVAIDGMTLEGTVEWLAAHPAYREWNFSFTMPDTSVTITAESWCFIDDSWIKDAEDTENIYITEPPPGPEFQKFAITQYDKF